MDISDLKTYKESQQVARRCESTLRLGVRLERAIVEYLEETASSWITGPDADIYRSKEHR